MNVGVMLTTSHKVRFAARRTACRALTSAFTSSAAASRAAGVVMIGRIRGTTTPVRVRRLVTGVRMIPPVGGLQLSTSANTSHQNADKAHPDREGTNEPTGSAGASALLAVVISWTPGRTSWRS